MANEIQRDDDSSDSRGRLKPIPREQALLETFFYTVAQFNFDRARELAEKEKESLRTAVSVGAGWLSLVCTLSNFAGAEKTYFSLAFLEKKLLRRDPLKPLYSGIATELSKSDGNVALGSTSNDQAYMHAGEVHGIEALSLELSRHLNQFARARQKMIEFYELMARSGLSHISNAPELIRMIEEIGKEFGRSFHHPILDPLKTSFGLEVEVVRSLFKALDEMSKWKFLESLLLLRECQAKLNSWCLLSPSTSVKEQLLASIAAKSFFNRQGNRRPGDVPFLYSWLHQVYDLLVSKFTLYFFTTLSAQTSPEDLKKWTSKLFVDFMAKLVTFQRKTDAYCVSLVLETHRIDDVYGGHGYRLTSTIVEKPKGVDSYPSIICIPEKRPTEHWPGVISMLTSHDKALQVTDKIVFFYDEKMDCCYYMIRVDLCMVLVAIYNSKKKEKDKYIQTTLSEVRSLLSLDQLYLMLKPRQGQKYLT